MKLSSPDGQSFQLQVLGYAFPECETEEYDSNWLRIQLTVTHPRGTWTACDPALLTYEVADLADWLENVAEGSAEIAECGFVEPNLSFVLLEVQNVPKVRIFFELELRPPWSPSQVAGQEDLWVEFPVEPAALFAGAASLRDQLRAYPQRARL